MSSWDESRFAACFDEYEEEVQRLVELVAEAEVYPFLEKRGYRFVSGMGEFVLCDADDKVLPKDLYNLEDLARKAPDDPGERTRDEVFALDEEYMQILRVLWEDVPAMTGKLGNFMDDYTPVSRRGDPDE